MPSLILSSLWSFLFMVLVSRSQTLGRPIKSISFAANCAELYKAGNTSSGVYTIDPDGVGAFDVYCDQSTTGGGWTVIQRRMDGSVNFDRNWCDYKHGFGNMSGEYWLGLDKINRLTWRTKNKLRVDLEFRVNQQVHHPYAEYDLFVVESELKNYSLIIGGVSAGDAGNSFDENNKARFLTSERDDHQCPKTLGAWWYPETGCGNSNLNGEFQHGDGLRWSRWSKSQPGISATKVDMKIKPDCTE